MSCPQGLSRPRMIWITSKVKKTRETIENHRKKALDTPPQKKTPRKPSKTTEETLENPRKPTSRKPFHLAGMWRFFFGGEEKLSSSPQQLTSGVGWSWRAMASRMVNAVVHIRSLIKGGQGFKGRRGAPGRYGG